MFAYAFAAEMLAERQRHAADLRRRAVPGPPRTRRREPLRFRRRLSGLQWSMRTASRTTVVPYQHFSLR